MGLCWGHKLNMLKFPESSLSCACRFVIPMLIRIRHLYNGCMILLFIGKKKIWIENLFRKSTCQASINILLSVWDVLIQFLNAASEQEWHILKQAFRTFRHFVGFIGRSWKVIAAAECCSMLKNERGLFSRDWAGLTICPN